MSKFRFKVHDHSMQNSTLNDLCGVDVWDHAEPEYPHPVCRVWFADGSWGEAEHDPEKLIAHILSWDGE